MTKLFDLFPIKRRFRDEVRKQGRDVAAKRLLQERTALLADALPARDGRPVDVPRAVDFVLGRPFSTSRARSVRIVLWFQSCVARSRLMTSAAVQAPASQIGSMTSHSESEI